jgi:hypothetical protein
LCCKNTIVLSCPISLQQKPNKKLVTATALNNKGYIEAITLGVTADNINNAEDGKMLAVDATFSVDTFVNSEILH